MTENNDLYLARDQVLPLLKALPDFGNMTTIIFSSACVFEFKGPFPSGEMGEGYYNLNGPVPGLHGHLRLESLDRVHFQDKPHRGRASYAFVFEDKNGNTVFKVFLGRDADGDLIPEQLELFQKIRSTLTVNTDKGEQQ